ncbi:hypothetical protein EXS65_04460 [Candidatus Peribacteria bacterium]|nr:hypothetical protein [Candidatus Peribacteria bacterium]
MTELLYEKSWSFGGISAEKWGTEKSEHKQQSYPTVLLQAMAEVRAECMQFLNTLLGEDQNFFHTWLTEEMLMNAMHHGNDFNPALRIEVQIVVTEVIDGAVRKLFCLMHTIDEGMFFNPADVPRPTDDEMLGNPTGRGVHVTAELAEKYYAHKSRMSVDASVSPKGCSSGKRVTFQWYREIPVVATS